MNIAAILAMPTVQAIISAIEKECSDTTSHKDYYRFLEDDELCEVNSNGETKTVFLRKDWDFVIKVPNYAAYSRNYCELEAANYLKAVALKVEKVLLETAPLCVLDSGIQLYVQPRYSLDHNSFRDDRPRCKTLERKLNNLNKQHSGTAKALAGMYQAYRIDEIWFSRLVQLYGKKFVRSLERWTQENQVGDLHCCNIGWMKNRPIILDYSGYFG